jgi:quercetin dioxygenase-like cupin family protein
MMTRARIVVLFGMAAVLVTRLGDALPRDAAVTRVHHDAGLAWGPCPPVFPGACEVAVLQGDPAEPHADVFLRLAAGYTIPPHRHTSAEHMVLVAGELQVTYAGQPPFTMREGSYAFGPAKAPHEGGCVSKSPCVLFIAFESPMDAEAVASIE